MYSIRGRVERGYSAIQRVQILIYVDHIFVYANVEHSRNGGKEM